MMRDVLFVAVLVVAAVMVSSVATVLGFALLGLYCV